MDLMNMNGKQPAVNVVTKLIIRGTKAESKPLRAETAADNPIKIALTSSA